MAKEENEDLPTEALWIQKTRDLNRKKQKEEDDIIPRNFRFSRVTKPIIEEIRRLAGVGMTKTQIHYYYGRTPDEWATVEKQNPNIEQAMREGKSMMGYRVMNKLYAHIEKGSLSAMFFYLKTQFKWSELTVDGKNHDGAAAQPTLSLTINDPVEAAKIYQQIMTGANP